MCYNTIEMVSIIEIFGIGKYYYSCSYSLLKIECVFYDLEWTINSKNTSSQPQL